MREVAGIMGQLVEILVREGRQKKEGNDDMGTEWKEKYDSLEQLH